MGSAGVTLRSPAQTRAWVRSASSTPVSGCPGAPLSTANAPGLPQRGRSHHARIPAPCHRRERRRVYVLRQHGHRRRPPLPGLQRRLTQERQLHFLIRMPWGATFHGERPEVTSERQDPFMRTRNKSGGGPPPNGNGGKDPVHFCPECGASWTGNGGHTCRR